MFETKRSYFGADLSTFAWMSADAVLGELASRSEFDVDVNQRDAWVREVGVLKAALAGLQGTLFMEFNVPRIGTRVDAIVIVGPAIFVIEFKVGESRFTRGDLNQVWDYALDLKNFHSASHGAPIIPILVATDSSTAAAPVFDCHADGVYRPIGCSPRTLRGVIVQGLSVTGGPDVAASDWESAPYQPTPTIIEAAQRLYARHSVDSIARNDAGARNLKVTSQRIEELVEQARREQVKVIVFVTGVPGAGKTLVGLNIATQRRAQDQPTHAVFLSGNGPLVDVLREALARDEMTRVRRNAMAKETRVRKGDVKQRVKAFIQNVHHFRDAGLRDEGPPSDRVVIFDEAQRAWDQEMTASFMRRKKNIPGFTQSEPEFLISYLDRHEDWAVVICLVGGGQEINRGEAGIGGWFHAIQKSFPNWMVYVSPELTDTEYAAGNAIELLAAQGKIQSDPSLHLAVSMRSFRAENVSGFVKALLDCDCAKARAVFAQVSEQYPIALTRNLEQAKDWTRAHARGSERFGMVASSEAQRLKPHAIDVRIEINPVHWFLSDPADTRSSFYLEDAATEFQVQGLELDWVCMTWDADLRFNEGDWHYRSFVGRGWKMIHKLENQGYLRNAYRVLLTRARQGMVIFVPTGSSDDPTRSPDFYDPTFDYLASLGVPVL